MTKEFGHKYATVRDATGQSFHIDAWGTGPFVICVGGKAFRFEDSDRFGPYLVSARGDVLDKQPSERSPFWRAHRIWARQGRRLEGEVCIWDEPKPTKVVKISGRRAFVVDYGEEDGETIVVEDEAARTAIIAKLIKEKP
ncbi:hypothetical protein [Methylosinus sporium]|uniref:Uncharacterized protein n=1 Tax=Methylosinus sporium TaxID=428 RepID=A0A2U1SSP0_METSR|nr:hypothetical protein [Methylosinus sporium]PWB94636.1 hypothetical protein C5689_06120 [Methylosinus sporium]